VSGVAEALDHVGIAGADLATLADAFLRLGFTLTPVARHSGRTAPDGPLEKFSTGNRCAMLRQGYLELIAVVDPAAPGIGLAGDGLQILALAIDDEAANLDRLRRAGGAIAGVAALERPVDDADPAGPLARFARLPLPDAPEGRLQLIRHLTPEAIWQERFMHHRNHVVALEEVRFASAEPAATAARLSLLAGRPFAPGPEGGFLLTLPHGRLRVLPGDPGTPPRMTGIRLRTDDGNAAITALLRDGGIDHDAWPAGLLVRAGGAELLFAG
jgi:hypothetical protein